MDKDTKETEISITNNKKKNIILDLDNTLIYSIPLEEFVWDDENMKRIKKFDFYNLENYYLVLERPFLQAFLDELFEKYNVSVWSAGSKDYVLHIIDLCIHKKPERKLDYILFNYHCNLSRKKFKGIKNLKILYDVFELTGYSKNNTIIIDDLDKVKKINKDNCISIKEFTYDDEEAYNDKELLRISHLLDKMN